MTTTCSARIAQHTSVEMEQDEYDFYFTRAQSYSKHLHILHTPHHPSLHPLTHKYGSKQKEKHKTLVWAPIVLVYHLGIRIWLIYTQNLRHNTLSGW